MVGDAHELVVDHDFGIAVVLYTKKNVGYARTLGCLWTWMIHRRAEGFVGEDCPI